MISDWGNEFAKKAEDFVIDVRFIKNKLLPNIVESLKDKYDLHLFEDVMPACEKCSLFKEFGNKCWFFWEHKKDCSQRK